ncbi:MAG: hydroxyisourate hydrolase [Mycobacteriales bacterium]
MSLSTHVLDATTGRPAAGVRVELRGVLTAATDADGRCALVPGDLPAGDYELSFDTGGYFAAAGVETFYPRVTVAFTVRDATARHHVPLLLSPWSYTTYRGS